MITGKVPIKMLIYIWSLINFYMTWIPSGELWRSGLSLSAADGKICWKRGDCWLDFLPTRSWQRVILPCHPTISCISCHVKVRSMIVLLWRHFKRLGTKFCYQVSLWVGSVLFLTGRLFQSFVTTQKILHSSSFNKSEHFKQNLILHVLKLKPNLL